jgi:hypothetical protein
MHANEEIKLDEYNIKHSLPVNRHALKDIAKPPSAKQVSTFYPWNLKIQGNMMASSTVFHGVSFYFI